MLLDAAGRDDGEAGLGGAGAPGELGLVGASMWVSLSGDPLTCAGVGPAGAWVRLGG